LLRSLGIGAVVVAAISVLATLTLLPSWLALLGDRTERLRLPFLRRRGDGEGRQKRFWGWVAEFVMEHPVPSLIGSAALLLALAIPVVDLTAGSYGVTTLPSSSQSRQGFEALTRDFPRARSEPVEIVVDGSVNSKGVSAAISRLEASLRQDRAFGPPTVEVNKAGDLALVSSPIAGDPEEVAAKDAVKRLRSQTIPAAFSGADAKVYVTGTTARDVDYIDANGRALPFVIVFVLSLSFVLLMIVFRSVVVPAKAVVFNLLSTGAAYGLIVLVFEKGYGASLLGFQHVQVVEAWVPVFLFAVLFGLSMDYHVFLLSRIREEFNQTGDNRAAVAHGITSTAGIITGAALIMVAVFSGFALGDLVPFQQLGFGMGVALLLDATIVRSVLVPAGMRLLGARNWYLPKWLRWLPHIDVEGRSAPEPASPPAASEAVVSS
jgi:RND superfamily putative drug exporter